MVLWKLADLRWLLRRLVVAELKRMFGKSGEDAEVQVSGALGLGSLEGS